MCRRRSQNNLVEGNRDRPSLAGYVPERLRELRLLFHRRRDSTLADQPSEASSESQAGDFLRRTADKFSENKYTFRNGTERQRS